MKERLCPIFLCLMKNVRWLNVGPEGVMGYFRPMSQFNNGKQSEFKERKWFTEEKAKEAKECKKLTK